MILFALITLFGLVYSADVLCPISKSPDFSSNGDLQYPIEFYNPIVHDEAMVPCTSLILDQPVNYSCPEKFLSCPVTMENILDGMNSSRGWPKSTDLCKWKKNLDDPNSVTRLFLLGGSVAFGQESKYCCNKPECTTWVFKRCPWLHYLQRWLQFTSKGSVQWFNLGRPGADSAMMAHSLFNKFDEIKVTSLTSQDVIFLDHSYNDRGLSQPLYHHKILVGLESVIHNLLSMAENPSQPPMIIIFEDDTRPVKSAPDLSYTLVYRQVAKYYGLRLYSYRDAVLSENAARLQSQYRKWLSYELYGHPPWNVHLFYADLVAGALVSEFNTCGSTSEAIATPPPYIIPKPIANLSAITVFHCEVPIARLSYKDIVGQTTVGKYHIPRNNTWQVTLDHKMRGGIILELNETSDFAAVDHAPLVIDLGVTVDHLKSHKSMILQLEYMKSYENAGRIEVVFCNGSLTYDRWHPPIDALWEDYNFHRYTIPEVYTEPLNLHYDYCAHLKNTDHVTLEIRYLVTDYKTSMKELVHTSPRKRQLFKIDGIHVCELKV